MDITPRQLARQKEMLPPGVRLCLLIIPGLTKQGAIAVGLPGPNPFAEIVGEVPLETELCELAAHNRGVQLTDTYQIHTDTPAGGSLAVPTRFQEPEDPLPYIRMSVRLMRMIEAKGVPTGEASTADGRGPPKQTIITHRDTEGVIISILDDSSRPTLPEPPGAVGGDELYEINTDFAADLLKDGGEETIAQLMETYHPASDSPLDIPTIELDFNQFELDESGSGPETRSGPGEEPGEPAIVTEAAKLTTQPSAPKAGATEEGDGSCSDQPGPQAKEDETKIPGVGLFQHDS